MSSCASVSDRRSPEPSENTLSGGVALSALSATTRFASMNFERSIWVVSGAETRQNAAGARVGLGMRDAPGSYPSNPCFKVCDATPEAPYRRTLLWCFNSSTKVPGRLPAKKSFGSVRKGNGFAPDDACPQAPLMSKRRGPEAASGSGTRAPVASSSAECEGKCQICLEPLLDDLGMLCCGHTFHHACAKAWLATSSRCPVCSRESAQVTQLFLKMTIPESIGRNIHSVLARLDLKQAQDAVAREKEALQKSKVNHDQSQEQLEMLFQRKESLQSDIEALEERTREDERLLGEKRSEASVLQRTVERIKTLEASHEAITKIEAACRRAAAGRDGGDEFMNVAMRFNGGNRLFLLQTQLKYFARERERATLLQKKLADALDVEREKVRKDVRRLKREVDVAEKEKKELEEAAARMQRRAAALKRQVIEVKMPLRAIQPRGLERPRKRPKLVAISTYNAEFSDSSFEDGTGTENALFPP